MHDEAQITVRSGSGGAGAVSFRREKHIEFGGPDGGDGGHGGDVILVASHHHNTLSPFIRKRRWRAPDGERGGVQKCTGADGDDLVLQVPCGTLVRHAETGELLADLTSAGQRVVIAPGGRGGWGNVRYATATNQAPRQHGHGEPGVELPLALELKLIADVGLLGMPNAGKSTLLSRLSRATPKIAPYPFTTLDPQLGVVDRGDESFVIADIPGLIEGAAEGAGLGHRFLRHVERCRLLIHLVDGSEGDAEALAERVRTLDSELARFSPVLAAKPQLLVFNKSDTRPELPEVATEATRLLGRDGCLVVSGVAGTGLDDLLRAVQSAT